jgi:phytoene dehydrogenase-like protein
LLLRIDVDPVEHRRTDRRVLQRRGDARLQRICVDRSAEPVGALAGRRKLADALADHLRSLGGTIEIGRQVESFDELRDAAPVLLDLTPRQVLRVAGDRMPDLYRRGLSRCRYGPGIFKLDWALDGPIPWRAPEAARAGTVHLGGTLDEIVASEDAAAGARHHDRPSVLLVQPTPFDPTRAPEGKHTAWAYRHVPSGSTRDMTGAIEGQVERFAPGFCGLIAARSAMDSAEVERRNSNYVGGDINGGDQELRQLFTRPVARPVPYAPSSSRPARLLVRPRAFVVSCTNETLLECSRRPFRFSPRSRCSCPDSSLPS